MCASPAQDQVTIGEVVLGPLSNLDASNLSVEQMDDVYAALRRIIGAIDTTPVMLLRAALDQVEANDGSMMSEAASYAAQAIDAAYPDWGGVIGTALDEQFLRENATQRDPEAIR